MTKPVLSIIIPTLNEEKYLGKLLESLVRQNFKDFEVVVVDGNSKDKTLDVAKRYAKALNLKAIIERKKSIGLARNRGADLAKGEYLLFLDADVILPNDFLKKSLNEFERRFLDVGTVLAIPQSNTFKDYFYYAVQNSILRFNQYISPMAIGFCIFSTKRVYSRVKGFDENIKLGEDNDYVERAGKVGKFRLMKSCRIFSSIRRFEAEGHSKVAMQYSLSGLYRTFKGYPENDLFKYHFGGHDALNNNSDTE